MSEVAQENASAPTEAPAPEAPATNGADLSASEQLNQAVENLMAANKPPEVKAEDIKVADDVSKLSKDELAEDMHKFAEKTAKETAAKVEEFEKTLRGEKPEEETEEPKEEAKAEEKQEAKAEQPAEQDEDAEDKKPRRNSWQRQKVKIEKIAQERDEAVIEANAWYSETERLKQENERLKSKLNTFKEEYGAEDVYDAEKEELRQRLAWAERERILAQQEAQLAAKRQEEMAQQEAEEQAQYEAQMAEKRKESFRIEANKQLDRYSEQYGIDRDELAAMWLSRINLGQPENVKEIAERLAYLKRIEENKKKAEEIERQQKASASAPTFIRGQRGIKKATGTSTDEMLAYMRSLNPNWG